MPNAEMLTMHSFDDWLSAARLSKVTNYGPSIIGLISEGTLETVRWIDGTPFDYNNTQSAVPFSGGIPGADYCGSLYNSGYAPYYQLMICNQTNSFSSAVCSLSSSKETRDQSKQLSEAVDIDGLRACSQPAQPLTCAAVISYFKCLGYSIVDCTEQNGNIYYKINSLPQIFDILQQSCSIIAGGNAVSVHDAEEAIIVRWLGCSGYGQGGSTTQTFVGLTCEAPECKAESLAWSDGSAYDYKVIRDDYLNGNYTEKQCFVANCVSPIIPMNCVDNTSANIICKAPKQG